MKNHRSLSLCVKICHFSVESPALCINLHFVSTAVFPFLSLFLWFMIFCFCIPCMTTTQSCSRDVVTVCIRKGSFTGLSIWCQRDELFPVTFPIETVSMVDSLLSPHLLKMDTVITLWLSRERSFKWRPMFELCIQNRTWTCQACRPQKAGGDLWCAITEE